MQLALMALPLVSTQAPLILHLLSLFENAVAVVMIVNLKEQRERVYAQDKLNIQPNAPSHFSSSSVQKGEAVAYCISN